MKFFGTTDGNGDDAAIDNVEELLINIVLQDWKTDVPGMLWLLREGRLR